MAHVIVGRWSKNLAIRVPFDVAGASGLSDGEEVEIETQDGDILIRRSAAHAQNRRDAENAAAEIIAESRTHSLGGLAIRDLIDEGRLRQRACLRGRAAIGGGSVHLIGVANA